ncbi:MAG: FCD domain-containing protein [Sutterella sp.]|nr:FCD domain-containing protein [Sutterella sp.]
MAEMDDFFYIIQKYVESKALEPGAKLENETVLAEKFGVTRYRVRQALERLRQMGILDRVKRRGSVIKNINQHDLSTNLSMQMHVAGFNEEEYHEARSILECAIIPLICKRRTPALIGSLTDEINAIRASSLDPQSADEHLRSFHLKLIQGCGNRVLQTFSSVVIRYFASTHYLVANAPATYFMEVADQLQDVVNAVQNNNPKKAYRLLDNYLKKQTPNFDN